ncbi:MAG: hypothetical protein EXS10_01865 [Phycisphaerales bacterium]|nr:hypothetical protein [Phycisphaerales bacterium]
MSNEATTSPEPTSTRASNLPLLCGALGLASLLLSPFIIGLLPGALGLRTSIDARRIGFRGILISGGMTLSVIGLTLSIVAALVWGGMLATILMSREAERDAVIWRGREIKPFTLQLDSESSFDFAAFREQHPTHRLVLLFWSSAFDPCKEGVAHAIEAADGIDEVTLLGIAPEDTLASGHAFLGADAANIPTAYGTQRLPPPLETAGVRPTIVVVHPDGHIELVLLGVRGTAELKRAFVGAGFSP